MAKSLLDKILDYFFDSEWKGRRGERLVEKELRLVGLLGRKGKILKNVYLPASGEETSEVDVIYISQKGIFIIESKNYSGWIFGDEKDKNWTVSLQNRQKFKFYNPILQNKTHLKWMRKFVGDDVPLFSIVAFSERCELKRVTVRSEDVRVIKRDRLYATIRSIWKSVPDALDEEEVNALRDKLYPLTQVDKATKEAHVAKIREKYR